MSVAGVVAALHGRCSSLFESVGLRSLILNAPLGFSNLDHATIPLHVVATDIERAEVVVLSRGPAALLASTAIPRHLATGRHRGPCFGRRRRTGERAIARGRRAGSGGDSREGAARGGGRVIQPFPTFSEVFLGAMLELRKRAAA